MRHASIRIFVFWLLIAEIDRVIFIIYHWDIFSASSTTELLQTFYKGLKLDISASCYLSAASFLLYLIYFYSHKSIFKKIFYYATILLSVCVAGLYISNFELFAQWGTKINAQILLYLDHPEEMIASTRSLPWIKICFAILVLGLLLYTTFTLLIKPIIAIDPKPNHLWKNIALAITLLGFMFLGIRGGIQLIPINQSSAFFSHKSELNYASVNTVWNFLFSILKSKQSAHQYDLLDQSTCDSIFATIPSHFPIDSTLALPFKNPNIVFIILESWTQDAIGLVEQGKEVTPFFNRLIPQSYYFQNMISSGDRTDKGLVAVFSGFPSQPNNSIIKEPDHFKKLPALSSTFSAIGYTTIFFYGGETEFANMKAYLLNKHIQTIIDKSSFDKKDMNSKWGAYDNLVFEKSLEVLDTCSTPFFATILTLTSHEPFEIPIAPLIAGNDDRTKFINSIHYTDKSLQSFFEQAKTHPWYDSTIFLLVADHGHRLIGQYQDNISLGKFRIPCLIYNSQLDPNQKRINNNYCSQHDIPAILLHSLGMEYNNYPFSNPVSHVKHSGFGYYSFTDGLGFANKDGNLVYDNVSKNILIQNQFKGDTLLHYKQLGISIQQQVMRYFKKQ